VSNRSVAASSVDSNWRTVILLIGKVGLVLIGFAAALFLLAKFPEWQLSAWRLDHTKLLTPKELLDLENAMRSQVIDLLKSLLWPATIVVVILIFRNQVIDLLRKAASITLQLPGGISVGITVGEAQKILQDLLSEIDQLIESLTQEDVAKFIAVAEKDQSGNIDVVPAGFKRSQTGIEPSEEHERLRRLRGAHLIRPREGGQWREGKHILLTSFGRMVFNARQQQLRQKAQDKNAATPK
jgi:DNA-binding transcriptional ArsR family regulator